MMVRRAYRTGTEWLLAISLLGIVLPQGAVAQDLNAVFETTGSQFLIGEHIPVTLKVTADQNTVVQWPDFGDTLPAGLTILRKEPVDTLQSEAGKVMYLQRFLVTAFDSGTYAVEPTRVFYSIPGSSNKMESYTPPLLLTLSLADVSADDEIRDIKPPFSFPVTLREILLYLSVLIIQAAIVFFLIRYFMKRKRRQRTGQTIVLPLPAILLTPWQIALEALSRLTIPPDGDGEIKRFYEQVSGIVRIYLRDGLMVNAPELTTRQVIRRIDSRKDIAEVCKVTLRRILQESDMVKFARFRPDINQRHALIEDAVRFISDTAPAFVDPAAIQITEGEAPL